MNNFVCRYCRHVHIGHRNIYGKICIKCERYHPADVELPIVQENRVKKEEIKRKIIEYLLKKQNGE